MAKDQQNIFLIQELERILTEIICPVDYIMDVFISDIMHDDCVIEKYMYRKRKNFLLKNIHKCQEHHSGFLDGPLSCNSGKFKISLLGMQGAYSRHFCVKDDYKY